MREDSIILRCTVCKEENYTTVKNKRNTPEKLELKKYCKKCRKATVHQQKK